MLLHHVEHQSVQPRWKCWLCLFVRFDCAVYCQYYFSGLQFYKHLYDLAVCVLVSCSWVKVVMKKILLLLWQSVQTSLTAKLCLVSVILACKRVKTKYVFSIGYLSMRSMWHVLVFQTILLF